MVGVSMPTEQPYLNQLNARFDQKQSDWDQVKRKRQESGQRGEEIKQTEASDEEPLWSKHTWRGMQAPLNLM